MAGGGGLKDNVKKYAAALLPTAMYFSDATLDTASSVDFCTDGQTWWCAISAGFIIAPEILVSAFIAYKIWRDRDKTEKEAKSEDYAILSSIQSAAVKTIVAVLFFLFVPTMILPFVMLPWLSSRALQDEKPSDGTQNATASDGGQDDKASDGSFGIQVQGESASDRASAAVTSVRKAQLAMIQLKGMETILQTLPQLSLKSYVVIHKLHCNKEFNNETLVTTTTIGGNIEDPDDYCADMATMDPANREVGALDVISPFFSLCSLCFSIASFVVDEHSDDWYRKSVWFIALLGSMGSRMMVCGVLASWNQALWLAPPLTACGIVIVLKTLRYYILKKPFSKKAEFQVADGESPFPRVALMVVLEEALLLSYPSFEGLLACASYIGFAVWFYVYGIILDETTDVELGVEALSTSILGQGISLLVAFIARRLDFETPDLMPKSSNKDTSASTDIEMTESANNHLTNGITGNTNNGISESTNNLEGTTL